MPISPEQADAISKLSVAALLVLVLAFVLVGLARKWFVTGWLYERAEARADRAERMAEGNAAALEANNAAISVLTTTMTGLVREILGMRREIKGLRDELRSLSAPRDRA